MVRITEDLVRRRAEHNECEIFSLEELSLHQQDIEKIENLDRWCKHLRILYLQSNLISKIENCGRLKKLEYLNLALNNIEKIENLEGCESLQKLDLTVNFVGMLTSVEALQSNHSLQEMYLTGNPCVNYVGYREYVVAALPQLCWLDGKEIEKSERIKASQVYSDIRREIMKQEVEYLRKRESERENKQAQKKNENTKSTEGPESTDVDFWNKKCDFTPESRKEIQDKIRENREKKHKPLFEKPEVKRRRRFFNNTGDPMNVNEGKVDFTLTESEDDKKFVLDVACYRFLDTSLIDVDIEPKYVRVTMKEKVLQLALQEEVRTDECMAKRSQATGHLLVTMPKLEPPPKPSFKKQESERNTPTKENKDGSKEQKSDILEFIPEKSLASTLANIVTDTPASLSNNKYLLTSSQKRKLVELKIENCSFKDDPEVPPLV